MPPQIAKSVITVTLLPICHDNITKIIKIDVVFFFISRPMVHGINIKTYVHFRLLTWSVDLVDLYMYKWIYFDDEGDPINRIDSVSDINAIKFPAFVLLILLKLDTNKKLTRYK